MSVVLLTGVLYNNIHVSSIKSSGTEYRRLRILDFIPVALDTMPNIIQKHYTV